MSKFKVGDEVVRTHPSSKLVVGETYIIKEILSSIPAIILEGYSNMYNLDNFELAEIDSRVVDTSEILTPLQVAEALINGDDLEYTYNGTIWMSAEQEYGEVFFYNDGVYKYRVKPKTIVINGVEVVAPLTRKPNQEFIYFINFFKSRVYQLPTENLTFNHKYFWATKEDAQQVLNAMLIPFKEDGNEQV